jgi:hypothetical protein
MKKIIGVALFFLVAAAPALAGGNSGGGGGSSMSSGGSSGGGGGFRVSSGGTSAMSGGFGSQSQRSFAAPGIAPPTRLAPPTRFAPPTREMPSREALQVERKRIHPEWAQSERYMNYQPMCPKNPYQQPALALNGCAANPGVLLALPNYDDEYGD